MKTGSWRDIWTPIFTAALFTTAKTWRQPRGLSVGGRMKKVWYRSTTEYYLFTRRKDILPSSTTWMGAEGIRLSETGQIKTNTLWLHMWNLKKKATHSSILAWRTPWTGEPGGLRSTGWQRVGNNWSDFANTDPKIKRWLPGAGG